MLAVATWFGGYIFFIGFVALSRREPFLAGIRTRLIYTYATAFRKTTHWILGFILLSGTGLQLIKDFVIEPRNYSIDGEDISMRKDMHGINRFVGWIFFMFTLILFMTGVFLLRKILIF